MENIRIIYGEIQRGHFKEIKIHLPGLFFRGGPIGQTILDKQRGNKIRNSFRNDERIHRRNRTHHARISSQIIPRINSHHLRNRHIKRT